MSDAPLIFTALAAVMADVQAVAKRDENKHQKFMFRGIDAVMNAVGPALRANQVIVTPDVREVTYQDVTTSTGKPATACRVEVAYTFYAIDGSSITTSVAGEAWDHGDKACPKAMSVAFRTALLQALCLPTDEPDPDSHTYQRAAVDLTELRRTIAAARAREIEGDYDGTLEWAAESQQNAAAAVRKLQKAIDKFDVEAEDAATQTGSRHVPPEDEVSQDTQEGGQATTETDPEGDATAEGGDGASGHDAGRDAPEPAPRDTGDGGSPADNGGTSTDQEDADDARAVTPPAGDGSEGAPSPATPAWRLQAEAEGFSDEQVLIALHGKGVWPADDQGSKPRKSRDLDAAAERHPELFASVIERLAQDARQKASA